MSDDPREALVTVARDIIAKRGYVGLTMKTASAAAGVTPDVARRYYRNREALFAAALRLPTDPTAAIPALVAPGVEGLGERLVRYTLDVLKDPETRAELVSLARTGVNAGHAVAGLQDFLEQAVVDRIASMIGVPDARMRSALITSYLLGVATTRYGVRLEPLASASEDDVIRMVAPVIQDLLDPRKPLPGRARSRPPQPPTARSAASPAAAGDAPARPTPAPAAPPATPTPPVPRKRTFDPDPKATAARRAATAATGEGARHARAGSAEEPAQPDAADPITAPGPD